MKPNPELYDPERTYTKRVKLVLALFFALVVCLGLVLGAQKRDKPLPSDNTSFTERVRAAGCEVIAQVAVRHDDVRRVYVCRDGIVRVEAKPSLGE